MLRKPQPIEAGIWGQQSHTGCHLAMGRCLYASDRLSSRGSQAQGPTCSSLDVGLSAKALGLPQAWLSRLLQKQGPPREAINYPVGEPKQAGLLEGGLVVALEAWLRWFTVHPQGSGLPFLTHTLPRGPVFTFPGLCPTQALAREEQAEIRAASPGSWRPAWSQWSDLHIWAQPHGAIYFQTVSTQVRTGNVSSDASAVIPTCGQ